MTNGVLRGRTALTRTELSRPVRLAIEDGLLKPPQSFFDYGCGHGHDVAALARDGYQSAGWDPIHRSDASKHSADVVNLGYVVNVIEDPGERSVALCAAWIIAKRLLVVAARTSAEEKDLAFREPLADGVRTGRSTFQKFYEQYELKQWVETTLGTEAIAAALGVFYVLRDDETREAFRARRMHRRLAAPSLNLSEQRCKAHPALVQGLVEFFVARGRLPVRDELATTGEIESIFGTVKRAFQAIRRSNFDVDWESITARRREDSLLYLALSQFERGNRWSDQPPSIQADIRALFGTYSVASRRAERLLLSIGRGDALEQAFAAAQIGKCTPAALYVHRSSLDQLPLLLRAFEGCARGYLGEVEGSNLVKLYRREPKISYLSYPDSERDAHPALAFSLNVDLREFRTKMRRFDTQPNPPILHRKELFVAHDFKRRATFARLTAAEERSGLLEDPDQIGLQRGWLRLLREKGFKLQGHRLIFAK
jgi:DNA phosphorothioation-associated putative methyltransferase